MPAAAPVCSAQPGGSGSRVHERRAARPGRFEGAAPSAASSSARPCPAATGERAAAGTAVPSTALPSTAVPGTAVPSTALPGTAVPGTVSPGTALPGTALPGTSPRPPATADAAEHGIWLCGGGPLPDGLLAALSSPDPIGSTPDPHDPHDPLNIPDPSDTLNTADNPGTPGSVNIPDTLNTADSPDPAGAPGAPTINTPGAPGNPTPGTPDNPDNPGTPDTPDNPSSVDPSDLVEVGFSQGGLLDGLSPGPELAIFLHDAADQVTASPAGLRLLGDDPLTGVLRGWRRLGSWAAAMEHAAAAELAQRRIDEAQAAGCWTAEAGRYAAAEVAAALTLTRTAADNLVGRALSLQELPGTAGALAAGQIDMPKALVITDGVACLDAGLARAVEHEVLAAAPRQTTGQLRAAVARAALAADPAAAEMRRSRAEKQARVEQRPEPSGVSGSLSGRDLPAADAAAAFNRITAIAKALKADGAAGGVDLLRAQVFLSLLLGRPAVTAAGDSAEQGIEPEPQQGDDAPGGAEPGMPAQGDIPAGLRRVLAAGTADSTRSDASDAGERTWPAVTGWAGITGSVNLTVPLTTWLGLTETPGDLTGYGPVTAGTARQILANGTRDPATRWCVTVTGDDGRAVGRAVGHGCAANRRAPGSVGGWLLTIEVEPVAFGDCDHRRESAGYVPTPALRHLIEIRNPTCTFPGCRHPAARCDKDHTLPYDKGGRTCECNLAPLCRFHHRLKQTEGWELEQVRPGVMQWSAPSGWRYSNAPFLLRAP
jgi:hypothetical protein